VTVSHIMPIPTPSEPFMPCPSELAPPTKSYTCLAPLSTAVAHVATSYHTVHGLLL